MSGARFVRLDGPQTMGPSSRKRSETRRNRTSEARFLAAGVGFPATGIIRRGLRSSQLPWGPEMQGPRRRIVSLGRAIEGPGLVSAQPFVA